MANEGREGSFSFSGILESVPNVLIDNFLHLKDENKIKYCFISHAHRAHYRGLLLNLKRTESCPTFLLTKTTFDLIRAQEGSESTATLLSHCKFLQINKEYQLEDRLKCTFIANYHCLGSVMILLKDSRNGLDNYGKKDLYRENVVLYTGDVRFDDSVISSVLSSNALSPFLYGDQKINMLYLDTTFAVYPEDTVALENLRGIFMLIRLINLYPEGTSFLLLDTGYEFVEVWLKLFQKFKDDCEFFLCDRCKDWVQQICDEESGHELEKHVTGFEKIHPFESPLIEKPKYKFYIGDKNYFNIQNDIFCVDIQASFGLSENAYQKSYWPCTGDSFKTLEEKDSALFYGVLKNFLIHAYFFKHEQQYFRTQISFMFSQHSSYSESLSFVQKLQESVVDIFPLTESLNTWNNGFQMSQYYGIEESFYDSSMSQKYGASGIVANQPSLPVSATHFDQDREQDPGTNTDTDTTAATDMIGIYTRKAGVHQSFDEKDQLLRGKRRDLVKLQRQLKKSQFRRPEEPLSTENSGNTREPSVKLYFPDWVDKLIRDTETKQKEAQIAKKVDLEKKATIFGFRNRRNNRRQEEEI